MHPSRSARNCRVSCASILSGGRADQTACRDHLGTCPQAPRARGEPGQAVRGSRYRCPRRQPARRQPGHLRWRAGTPRSCAPPSSASTRPRPSAPRPRSTLTASGDPITFPGLAKAAGVSIDFLYRHPAASCVEHLRANRQCTPPKRRDPELADQPRSQSNVVRALTAQLAELKRHHREEIARLEAALATAQGENLELRRRLGRSAPERQLGDPKRREPQAGDFIEPAPPARGAARCSWRPCVSRCPY